MAPKFITVSGTSYYDALDPNCSDAAKDHGWPLPECVTKGKGIQLRYPWSLKLANEIAWHLEAVGDARLNFSAAEDKPYGRAELKDAARIREQIKVSTA